MARNIMGRVENSRVAGEDVSIFLTGYRPRPFLDNLWSISTLHTFSRPNCRRLRKAVEVAGKIDSLIIMTSVRPMF